REPAARGAAASDRARAAGAGRAARRDRARPRTRAPADLLRTHGDVLTPPTPNCQRPTPKELSTHNFQLMVLDCPALGVGSWPWLGVARWALAVDMDILRFLRLSDIAERLDCRLEGDGGLEIQRVAGIEDAGPGDLTFFTNPKYSAELRRTAASAVIL